MKNSNTLTRIGNALLGLFARWEERGFMPRAAHWLKLVFLGTVVTAITAFCKKAVQEPMVMCYRVAPVPDVNITEIEITPNPTQGADSVRVKAIASVVEPELDSVFITGARLWLSSDTTPYLMLPGDGEWNDTLEALIIKLDISHLPPGTTWVNIHGETSLRGWGSNGTALVVSDD